MISAQTTYDDWHTVLGWFDLWQQASRSLQKTRQGLLHALCWSNQHTACKYLLPSTVPRPDVFATTRDVLSHLQGKFPSEWLHNIRVRLHDVWVAQAAADGCLHDSHLLTLLLATHGGRKQHGLHSNSSTPPIACTYSMSTSSQLMCQAVDWALHHSLLGDYC